MSAAGLDSPDTFHVEEVGRLLVGMMFSEAESMAIQKGYVIRDLDFWPRELFDGTCDPSRINVHVLDGKVTRFVFVG